MKSEHRFVHLSDIHFGQERSDGSIKVHDDVRNQLIADCKVLKERIGAADGIILTGDIAFKGDSAEFSKASLWLDDLSAAVGCSRTNIYVVPGNHDVDRRKFTTSSKLIQSQIRNSSSDLIDKTLADLAEENTDFATHPLFKPLSEYQKFAAQYGCDFTSTSKPFWIKEIQFTTAQTLRIVGLTSVQLTNKDDKKGVFPLLLGSQQYILDTNDGIETIVLLHHPLDWFVDGEKAKPYFRNRARIVMTGHEHVASTNHVDNGSGKTLVYIQAGAANPALEEKPYKFSYSWLSLRLGTGAEPILTLTTFPRIWRPGATEFRADSDEMELDKVMECRKFDIACPQFCCRQQDEASVASIPVANPAKASKCKQQSPKPSRQQEVAYETLRLLFWRYLDWQQRMKILFALDLIPKTLEQPLAQTMEALALEVARENNKLAELWEQIMEYVPTFEKKKNPFNSF